MAQARQEVPKLVDSSLQQDQGESVVEDKHSLAMQMDALHLQNAIAINEVTAELDRIKSENLPIAVYEGVVHGREDILSENVPKKNIVQRVLAWLNPKQKPSDSVSMEDRIPKLQSQRGEASSDHNQFSQIELKLNDARRMNLDRLIAGRFKDVMERFDKLYEEVSAEMVPQLQDAYIQQFILPEILANSDRDKASQIVNTIRQQLRDKKTKMIEGPQHHDFVPRDELAFDYRTIPTYLVYRVQQLDINDGRGVVLELFSDVVRAELTAWEDAFQNVSSIGVPHDILDGLAKRKDGAQKGTGLYAYLLNALLPQDIQTEWYIALQKTPLAQELFGKIIEKRSEAQYKKLLDQSFHDSTGEYIDRLAYYPRVETIQQLLLLAYADGYSHRREHGHYVLQELLRRPDFQDIFTHAVDNDPELLPWKEAIDFYCDSLRGFESYEAPPFNPQLSILARKIYRQSDNPSQKAVALQTLQLADITTLAGESGVLQSDQITAIQATLSLSSEISSAVDRQLSTLASSEEKKAHSLLAIPGHFINLELALKENLISMLTVPSEGPKISPYIARLVLLCKEMITKKHDLDRVGYLVSSEVRDILKNDIQEEDVSFFLNAPEHCPVVLTEKFIIQYLPQFRSEERLKLLNTISSTPELIQAMKISHEEARILMRYGDIVFQNEEDFTVLLRLIQRKQITEDQDLQFGIRFSEVERKIVHDTTIPQQERAQSIHQLYKLRNLFSWYQKKSGLDALDPGVTITEDNWKQLLSCYVLANEGLIDIDTSKKTILDALFDAPSGKDFVFIQLVKEWRSIVSRGENGLSLSTSGLLYDIIEQAGNVGILQRVNSLAHLIYAFQNAQENPDTAVSTKEQLKRNLLSIDNMFDVSRWSGDDRSLFYSNTAEVLLVSPSLAAEFINVFLHFSSKEGMRFVRELYPLYQAQLVIQQNRTVMGTSYNPRELVTLRKSIHEFITGIDARNQGAERQTQIDSFFNKTRTDILQSISTSFRERFGIVNFPGEFTPEFARTVNNMSMYLAHIHARDSIKEQILSLYIGLVLNGKWQSFREVQDIDISEFMDVRRFPQLTEFLKKRQELNPLSADCLGITEEELPRFQALLQAETHFMSYGQIQTIDQKVGSIVRGLQDLEDPDIYAESIQKHMIQYYIDLREDAVDSKVVNTVLAKSYQQLGGKPVTFTETEQTVQKKIEQIFHEDGLEWNRAEIQKIQSLIRPISMVVGMRDFLISEEAEIEIATLQELLIPKPEIIDLFVKMGEDFKPSSGAMALGQDLNYIENLLVKHPELPDESRALAYEYLDRIRGQMQVLEGILNKTQNQFKTLIDSVPEDSGIFANQVNELKRMFNLQATEQVITSSMTTTLDTMIENIRACLSCTNRGENNDTNLTFGDTNKFFLTSKSSSLKGSIADQIIFVEPMTDEDGQASVTFVLDQMYGSKSSDVLQNHIATVWKKYTRIMKEFHQAHLSIFIPDTTILSVGTTPELLMTNLRELGEDIVMQEQEVNIHVVPSAAGDHYIEFGSQPARTSGLRHTRGILLTLHS